MSVLTCEVTGPVALLTLNRPTAMNALSMALRQALAQAIQTLDLDPAIRAIILTGSGERAFSAGLDLKELRRDPAVLELGSPADDPVVAMEACATPIIAAINGVAITGGFELALAADILIASENARFADTHVRVGVMPGWGLSQKLSRTVGLARAKELSLTGNFINAATAQKWGLVNRVVPADVMMQEAYQVAADIADADPTMVQRYKALMDAGYRQTLEDGLRREGRVAQEFNGVITLAALNTTRDVDRPRSPQD